MVVLGIIYILVILKQFIDPGSKSRTCMEKKLKHVETIKQLYCKVIKSPNFQSTMSFFLIKKVSCHEQEHEHHIPWPWKYCIHAEPCSYSFLHGNISTVTSNLSFVHNTKIFSLLSKTRKESRTYLHLRNWIQIILAFIFIKKNTQVY